MRGLWIFSIILVSCLSWGAQAKCHSDICANGDSDAGQTSADASQSTPANASGGVSSADFSANISALPTALPCLSRSMYANGSAYTIVNTNGDIVANVTASSSSDLAAAFQGLVDSGQCLKNSGGCSRVEGTLAISSQGGLQRTFNVVDDNSQVLAVIVAATEDEANARFSEILSAGVCAGR